MSGAFNSTGPLAQSTPNYLKPWRTPRLWLLSQSNELPSRYLVRCQDLTYDSLLPSQAWCSVSCPAHSIGKKWVNVETSFLCLIESSSREFSMVPCCGRELLFLLASGGSCTSSWLKECKLHAPPGDFQGGRLRFLDRKALSASGTASRPQWWTDTNS